ncbi:MAG: tetratricopeptide repeat-containing sulfotransferase family protein, partial [Marinicella sp.]
QAPLAHQQQNPQLAQQGQLQQAILMSEQLVANYSGDAQAWINHSILLFQTGQKSAVINALEQAIKINPKHLPYLLHRIMALEAMGEIKSAIKFANDLAHQQLTDFTVIENLAAFLNKHQQFNSSVLLYQQAVKLQPQNTTMILNLAMSHQYLGDLAAAAKLADQGLQLEPNHADLHFFRAHLKKQAAENNHIKSILSVIDQPQASPLLKAKIYFALAKEYEDCQQFAESFSARSKGAKIYRNSFQYDLASDLQFMQAIEDNYTTSFLQQAPVGHDTNEPIFIVGLPRSGTTLLERIIGNHTDVISAGELTQFNHCMLQGIQQLKLNPQLSRAQMVAESVNMDFKALGQNYLNSTRPISGQTAQFIDKFPQNAQYVGLIHRALPQAKILILERHPMDVCYAVYKQMFTDIYQFSYDLEELAQYFIQHQQLMNHWQASLPLHVKTVRYENLVSNFESEARDVIQFCGLKWQDQCLNFHQNKQASTTASASQVRQKIYSSSVDLWKNYQEELKPLEDRLLAANSFNRWQ